jgi:hypothetical protein
MLQRQISGQDLPIHDQVLIDAGAGDGADKTLRLGDDDDVPDIEAPLATSSSLSPDQDPALLMPSTLLVLARDPASSAHSAVIDTTRGTSEGEPAGCCDSGLSTSSHAGGSVGCCCCCCCWACCCCWTYNNSDYLLLS